MKEIALTELFKVCKSDTGKYYALKEDKKKVSNSISFCLEGSSIKEVVEKAQKVLKSVDTVKVSNID